METSGQEISSSEEISKIPKLSIKEQEEVLQACSTDIEGMLDLEQIRCHLYQHNLLSDSECATLQAPDFELSRKTKIQMLITTLPRKGSDALDRFVRCLIDSANGTGHRELAQLICKKQRSQTSGRVNSRHKSKIAVCCCKCLIYAVIALLAVALICFVVSISLPIIMYHINLLHSKSLPYLSKNFVGREKELKEVSKLLDFRNSDTRIINIYGSPGFGKSTLAIHVGHKMVKEGVTVHYVNMDDFPDKDIKTALAEKILEAAHVVSKNVTFERLLRWARECSSRTLMILDNCDDLLHKKKEEFHQAIVKVVEESENNVKVILTSRKVAAFLMYIEYFKITELSITASCQLLEYKVPSSITLSMEEKEEIANLTGSVPLALQIIGSILRLPDSPSPSALINELKKELIKTLSPPEFPAYEQVFTTIGLSYKYLPERLRRIGCQLTVFPGSFKLAAAFAVCNSSTKSERLSDQFTSTEPTKEFSDQLKTLVRNALLEHSQRIDRYQYHRLIKEYFLLVQKRDWPKEEAKCLPAFHIYYSMQLIILSESFKYQYDQSLGFLDSEQHNLEYLFENLNLMQSVSAKKLDIEEFLVTALALSGAVDVHLLQVRFSMEKCCILLNSTLNKLDIMMPYLRGYLHGQSFEEKYILQSYLTIIKQVAECEIENHGVEKAMLVYSVRRTVIESKSAKMTSLAYVNFYRELGRLYWQLRFKKDFLECHRLIINRAHAHLDNCQPEQCQYYDLGIFYQSMGQYQEASSYFEEELKGSSDIMHQVRILVQLVYLYSYMNEYDKRSSTIARLQNLYSDIATAPIDQLIDASDATLMFIQFYKEGELFDKVQGLENRFLNGLLDLKSKIRTAFLTEQTAEYRKSLLRTACQALNNFFEAGNYSKTIEVGTFLMKLIDNDYSASFDDAKINLHLLIGKAKFHMGQYSDGMDHIELALQSIPNSASEHEKERSIACWYLIPRLTYLDTCYWIKWNLMMVVVVPVVITVVFAVSVGLYLILSPFPLNIFEKSIPRKDEKPVLTPHQLSPSTTLATTTRGLELSESYSKWLVMIQPQLKAALSGVKAIFQFTKDLKLSFVKFTRGLLYFTLCVLWVWVKLIYAYIAYIKVRWFRQPAKLRQAKYYFSHYNFYAFAVAQLLSTLKDCKNVIYVKETVRKIRDPRFQYGGDGTPHSMFIDSI